MRHFFDIGGHHGETFDYIATLPQDFTDCQFWVFEPSPRHFATLLEKCKSLAWKYDILVCPFGLGGHTRLDVFFEKDDDKGDSFKPWLASDHEVKNISSGYAIWSSIVALPEVILELTQEADEVILDIDAEGSEYEMVRALMSNDAAFSRVSQIMVEWHDIRDDNQALTHETFSAICRLRKIPLTHRGIYR